MRKNIFLVIFYIISFNVQSQHNYDVKSPNVSDFIRYGNIPIKMYVGELDLNIPLMTVPVQNQNPIQLSLSYNASGFIPNKRPGIVGLNWNLNGIGVVTREVRGVNDDYFNSQIRSGDGFIVGINRLKSLGVNLNTYNIVNNLFDSCHMLYLVPNATSITDSFELEPDVFHFNVNGISGSFFMGNDGNIKVINNESDNIKVDLTNFNQQPSLSTCSPQNSSEILIIDSKGNKYYFGGETKYIEYTLETTSSSQPIINSWYLKRIEYYKGDVLNFNYLDDHFNGDTIPFCNSTGFAHTAYNNDDGKKFVMSNIEVYDNRTFNNSGGNIITGGSGNRKTLNKRVFLDGITGTNFNIKFKYSSQGYIFNNDIYTNDRLFKEYKLDSIILKDNNNHQKAKINLQYSLRGGTVAANSFPRLFLDQVQEEGKKPYIFDYKINTNTILPKPSTCAIDFFGFYNGKLSNDAVSGGLLIPMSSEDANKDFSYINDTRNPNFNFAKVGMLTKVTYPTGGYSEFEYEPHLYSKRLERRSSNSFLPALDTINGIAGGIRIQKISDFDGRQNPLREKEYLYTNNDGSSSGILMQWDRTSYSYDYHYYCPQYWIGGMWYDTVNYTEPRAVISSSSINKNSVENSTINYSRVIEKQSGKGYTIYTFKSYIDTPDVNDNPSTNLMCSYENPEHEAITIEYLPETFMKNMFYLLNDRSIERGKLLSKQINDESNNIKVLEEYVYNTDSNRLLKFFTIPLTTSQWYYNSKRYYYQDYLTQKTTTEYTFTGNYVTTEKFNYGSTVSFSTTTTPQDVLLKKSMITSVNSEELETRYQYPWDVYSNASTDYNNFSTSNIAVPLRESIYRNNIKISESFTQYAKDATTNNYLLPKYEYNAKFPNNLLNITTVGNLEKKVTYDNYDNKGNITQFTKENGTTVSIIWGYNQNYPIAKIENATNAQIATALGLTYSTINETNLAVINSLRINAAFVNKMITTYTFTPLVGVSSITDPKGDTQTFIYDSIGRLLNVKDNGGNILSENQYHYKNQ